MATINSINVFATQTEAEAGKPADAGKKKLYCVINPTGQQRWLWSDGYAQAIYQVTTKLDGWKVTVAAAPANPALLAAKDAELAAMRAELEAIKARLEGARPAATEPTVPAAGMANAAALTAEPASTTTTGRGRGRTNV
jgi:hypothetical protein